MVQVTGDGCQLKEADGELLSCCRLKQSLGVFSWMIECFEFVEVKIDVDLPERICWIVYF